MRQKFIVLMWLWVASLGAVSLTAQENGQPRLAREELAEAQARHIASAMQLDDSTSRKLIDTYCRFQREVWSLGPRTGRSGARGAYKDADRAIRDRMARSQQLLDLRVKYFDEYRKFLTAEQVVRLYLLEHEIMERLSRKAEQGGRGK